jgi:DHA1 family bicyclomycin/chloramphenicol resistance-like MFS transporter
VILPLGQSGSHSSGHTVTQRSRIPRRSLVHLGGGVPLRAGSVPLCESPRVHDHTESAAKIRELETPAAGGMRQGLLREQVEQPESPGIRRREDKLPYGVLCCDAMCGCDKELAAAVGSPGQPGSATGDAQAFAVYGLTLAPAIASQSVWLILLSLNAIGPFSSDAYLPNLPDIEKDLGTSRALASLTIQINWIVLGLINPVIGSLSDTYGRKTITAVSLSIFVVGAVGSALSKTLLQLMIARVVMGVGQAVSVIASAVIRDLVDDPGERMRITGFFNMLQPLMILAAPSLGGVVGQLVGWRDLFWGLAGWGVLTMVLVASFVPESNKAYLRRTSSAAASSPVDKVDQALAERSLCAKLCEMFSSVPFTALTLTASVFMGGVRSMLSTIPYVYSEYYCLDTALVGILIAVPTGCGVGSSMVAVGVAKKADTGLLLRYGMLVGCLAPVALALGGYYYLHGWWTTTAAVAVMSATGFFVLPAMQVLILEDFKHMSGLTAGISKLVMTLISTGGSMVVSDLYDHSEEHGGSGSGVAVSKPGQDDCGHFNEPLGLSPAQFLCWALAIYMVATQLVFWVVSALELGGLLATLSRVPACVVGSLACLLRSCLRYGAGLRGVRQRLRLHPHAAARRPGRAVAAADAAGRVGQPARSGGQRGRQEVVVSLHEMQTLIIVPLFSPNATDLPTGADESLYL